MHIDIIVQLDNKKYPIELKYKTKTLEVKDNNEEYSLKDQSAQPLGRYDYLKDIQRLEELSRETKNYGQGFAILLTNDKAYWGKNRKGTIDEQFYLLQDAVKTGTMSWSKKASKGTIKSRETSIKLSDKYKIDWKDYSEFEKLENGEFKYYLSVIKK